jgi:ATP-dependent DNA helicase PIF1
MSSKRAADDDIFTNRPGKRRQLLESANESTNADPDQSTSQAVVVPPKTRVRLTQEQRNLRELVVTGRNVCFVGSAGCGKSTALRRIVEHLRGKLHKRVAVLASTGRAALEVDGNTIFSFMGWRPVDLKKSMESLRRMTMRSHIKKKLRETDVIVLDEISMVENHLFERFHNAMQAAKGNKLVFGGVQLVVTGDFFQLPPVLPFQNCKDCGKELFREPDENKYTCRRHGEFFEKDKWAFCSEAWRNANFEYLRLNQPHRQTDSWLHAVCEKIRTGRALTEGELTRLLDHPCDVQDAVQLCSTKNRVRSINLTESRKLHSETRTYTATDFWKPNPNHTYLEYKKQRSNDGSLLALQSSTYEYILSLKVGMRVILLINLSTEEGLANGSQGEIVGFQPFDIAEVPRIASRRDDEGFPSSDNRERLVADFNPMPISDPIFIRQENIYNFMKNERNQSKSWPIVMFDNGKQTTIFADCRTTALGDEQPYSLLARTQIPLLPAWAITIHKSQGMTLDKVVVDAADTFEEGQLYVALSRARNLEGLKVVGFTAEHNGAGANQEVLDFYQQRFGAI